MLNVWKNVKRYAQDGFTSVIHGKHWHEETQATASQATQYPSGTTSSSTTRTKPPSSATTSATAATATAFLARFEQARLARVRSRPHLGRIGLANQTTMLMSESLEIGEMFRDAMRDRYGDAALAERYRAFDTICSATQERQDAVIAPARPSSRST